MKKIFCYLFVIFGVICFISIFLLAFSFQKVPLNTVGIKQNIHSKSFSSNIYLPGRYYTGLVNTFITFPTNLQYIHFGTGGTEGAINSQSSEGTIISISCGMSYKVRRELIKSLYDRYPNKNYQNKLVSNAKSEIQAKAVEYTVAQYFSSRREIAYEFSKLIRTRFEEDFVELVDFQLFEISIPTTTEEVLIQNAVSTRQVLTQQEQAKISTLEGSMANLESESASIVSQINSNSTLESTTIISAL